jgi:acyl carrier protein
VVRRLADGAVEYLRRGDQQVKLRGYRIELGEVETVLSQHSGVREVVAEVRDERLVTYVVVKEEEELSGVVLRHYLSERVPEYLVPGQIVILKQLPLTPNGKLDRKALPAPDVSAGGLQEGFMSPRDTLELQLTQIWGNVLDVHPIGVKDNFFEVGGHSLLAVRLMAQIQYMFGKNLPLATLFEAPTIEQLADILRRQTDSLRWSPLVAIQPKGSSRPFFSMPGAGGSVIYFHALARRLGLDQPFYGLQARGLDGESAPHTRVEDIAAYNIDALQVIQPQGPLRWPSSCASGGMRWLGSSFWMLLRRYSLVSRRFPMMLR